MAEPNNPVLEHLRSLRAGQVRIEDRLDTLSAEMLAMRHMLAGEITLQQHDHSDIATLKVRLDRIEKRLDLVD